MRWSSLIFPNFDRLCCEHNKHYASIQPPAHCSLPRSLRFFTLRASLVCSVWTWSILKDPLTLTMMHCTLFILIRPDMGRDLSRGKITASHLEEEMNTEFEMSVVSNFLVSTSSPVRYQKPVKHYCGLCFGPLNPPSCSSRRGHFLRLQKSHLKEK